MKYFKTVLIKLFTTIPRNRARKTKMGMHTEQQMQHALDIIKNENKCLGSVAKLKKKSLYYPSKVLPEIYKFWRAYKTYS